MIQEEATWKEKEFDPYEKGYDSQEVLTKGKTLSEAYE